MKRILIVCVIILAGAAPAEAQRGTRGMRGLTDISISGGVSVPFGDFSDLANTGFHIGGDVCYYTAPRFGIGGTLAFNGYGASDLVEAVWIFETGDPNASWRWATFEFTGYGKLLFTDQRTSPYLKGGAGLYSLRATGEAYGVSASDSESDFGFFGGLGVQFRGRGSTGGFVEAAFHDILSEGISITYFGFRGGITFVTGR